MFSWQKLMMMHVKTHFCYFFQHTAVLLLLKQQLLVSLLILSLTSLSFFTTLCSKRLWSSRRCLRRAAPSGDSSAAERSGVRGVRGVVGWRARRPDAASARRLRRAVAPAAPRRRRLLFQRARESRDSEPLLCNLLSSPLCLPPSSNHNVMKWFLKMSSLTFVFNSFKSK